MGTSAQPKAVLVELFEAAAAAMGLASGREQLVLEFEDGRLRRWARTDPGNGANELERYDELLRLELDGLMVEHDRARPSIFAPVDAAPGAQA